MELGVFDTSNLKKRKVYLYNESLNKIYTVSVPIVTRDIRKKAKEKGFLIEVVLDVPWNSSNNLRDYIYANTKKECLKKVKNYYKNKIKNLKNIKVANPYEI